MRCSFIPRSRTHRAARSCCRIFSLTFAIAIKDWDPAGQILRVEDRIRAAAAGRNIFFFVSGGVDSTVAYTLCLRAVGSGKVHATYVDTGLMREGETEFVRDIAATVGTGLRRCGKPWSVPATHSPSPMRASNFLVHSRA